MSLFTSGDNGTFDTTTDPSGNPPSDWNITKAVDSIVKFNNVNPITGTGSMRCESRTIFNNNYALSSISTDNNNTVPYCNLLNPIDYDLSVDFTFDIKMLNSVLTGAFGAVRGIVTFQGATTIFRISVRANKIFVSWLDETSTLIFLESSNTISLDVENTISVDFNHGVSVDLTVNGVTTSRLTNATLNNPNGFTYSVIGVSEDPNDFGFYGYIRDFVYTKVATVIRDIKLNQEQGRFAFCTETQQNQGELIRWTDEEVSFGGGAWIDTTI